MGYYYKTSEIGGSNTEDIYEIGGEVIAFAVKGELVEGIIEYLNQKEKENGID